MVAVLLVPRLVDIQSGLLSECGIDLFVGHLEGVADLLQDLGELSTGDGQSVHVVQIAADGREGGVAHRLHMRDDRRQARADQPGFLDGLWDRGLNNASAGIAAIGEPDMLCNFRCLLGQVDLLNCLRRDVRRGMELPTAVRAARQRVWNRNVDLFGGERRPHMHRVSRLATLLSLAAHAPLPGRLDDIRRRRLRGRGRGLACLLQLCPEIANLCRRLRLEGGKLGSQLLDRWAIVAFALTPAHSTYIGNYRRVA